MRRRRDSQGATVRGSWRLDRAPNSIREYIKSRGFGRRVLESTVHVIWEQVVGAAVASHTTTIFCKDGKLVVTVDNPSWAHELSMRRHEIAQSLNDELGQDVVSDIHFQSKGKGGPKRGSPPVRRDELKFAGGMVVSDEELEAIPLSESEVADVERAVRGVRHEELRERVRRALIAEHRINAWKRSAGYVPCANPECGALHNEPYELCPGCRVQLTGGS